MQGELTARPRLRLYRRHVLTAWLSFRGTSRRSNGRVFYRPSLAASAQRQRSVTPMAFCSGIELSGPGSCPNRLGEGERVWVPKRAPISAHRRNQALEHVTARRRNATARPAIDKTTAPGDLQTARRCLSRRDRASHRPERPARRIRRAAAKREGRSSVLWPRELSHRSVPQFSGPTQNNDDGRACARLAGRRFAPRQSNRSRFTGEQRMA